MTPLLRMAAIQFLNPAPLMWNFEHAPEARRLGERYAIETMTPAECAEALGAGTADLGLIPIGALATTPGLAVVPGCAIASLGAIRSLLLILRTEESRTKEPRTAERTGEAEQAGEQPDLDPPSADELREINLVALDTSSRTTALYTQILFRRFWGHTPRFLAHVPELDAMLRVADAAVVIGDPALTALRDREARLRRTGERLRYLDLGSLWQQATGTAWVSAVWAIRTESLMQLTAAERLRVVEDLQASRDAGLAHIPELVQEWAPRLRLRPQTVERYLTGNIHYRLDEAAIAGVERFFAEAHALGLIPALPRIEWAG